MKELRNVVLEISDALDHVLYNTCIKSTSAEVWAINIVEFDILDPIISNITTSLKRELKNN